MIRSRCFSITTSDDILSTTVSIKNMRFKGAADSHSGVNIISPRALLRITKANLVKQQYFNCKYKLMVANKDNS